jgi:Ca2+/Na+ antiporter
MNILLVLGGTSLIGDLSVDQSVLKFDFWWMLGTAALLYPILKIGKNISRTEGAIYVISYMAFIYFTLV